jgi:hypothetical protein
MKKLVILLFAMSFVASCGGPEATDAPAYMQVDKSSTPNTLTDDEKKEGCNCYSTEKLRWMAWI